jgi:TM2 domain-containing membrane protein YozV
MTDVARGTFEVKLTPQPSDRQPEDPALGRMLLDKQFHGDLEATSRGQMLTAMTDVKGSAASRSRWCRIPGRGSSPVSAGDDHHHHRRQALVRARVRARYHDMRREEAGMAGQGSTGNVIAALASFFIPGLGQLLQGRLGMALVQFCLAAALWFILMGWIIHLWSILDAAMWKPKA